MREIYYIHNISHLPGATQVIPGVFVGGDVSSYIGDPDYKVYEYLGYASWFEGQLDGEIEHNSWILRNDCTAEEVFGDE